VRSDETIGLDGVSFGLETDGVLGSVRLRWWYRGPREWRDLVEWAGEMRAFLSRCLDRDAGER
jgi:hypothetical protein